MNEWHGNKGQELRDFTMRNITNSSIKCFDFSDAILTKFGFFWSNFTVTPTKILRKSFSELNDKFAMSLFYNQIGQKLTTNVEQSMSSNNPFITGSSMGFVSRFFKSCAASSLKSFLKPMKEANIGVGDLQNSPIMAVFITIARFVFKLAGMKTTFAINDTSKISKMNWIMCFRFVKNPMFMIDVIELHKPPMVTSSLNSIHMDLI